MHYNQCRQTDNAKWRQVVWHVGSDRKQSTPPAPLCCIASSVSNLTKHGDGTPCLAVVLAQARVPINGAQLVSLQRRRGVRGGGRRVELPCYRSESAPACRGRGLGDTSNVAQNGLYLFSPASSDVRTKWLQSSRVPLARPASGEQLRLIVLRKKRLELAMLVNIELGKISIGYVIMHIFLHDLYAVKYKTWLSVWAWLLCSAL